MISVVIAIHLMLVVGLIGVVLLQKSEGGGLVSSSSGFLSSRGTANALTRATALLAGGFFITSLVLSLLAGHERAPAPLGGGPAQQTPVPGSPPPAAPINGGSGGLLNQLGGGNAPPANGTAAPAPNAAAPAAPAPAAPAPGGPQVPQSR